ncbi:monocarboxylate transporter 12-like [Ptychodera flava]|uniref:monocarboxylate transporter 12-like n=1 Tax=Ptychodera flava TaxID=63121 RepID=UPI00396A43A9
MTSKRASKSPPDGGWGWLVVLASFLAQTLNAECMFAMGVFIPPLTSYFGADLVEVSTVFSITISLCCFVAPFSSFLDKYGTRRVVTAGGLITTSGLIASSFATSVYYLWFSYGFLVGLGQGMVYAPMFSVLGMYFKRYLGLASSLALTGVGVGYMAFSPIHQLLLDAYGWRGCFLVMAAINANLFVCAALVRPIEVTITTNQEAEDLKKVYTQKSRSPERNCMKLCCKVTTNESLGCGFVFRTRSFIFVLLGEALSTLTYATTALFIVPCVIEKGIPSLSASLLMSTVGIASLVARLFSAACMDLSCLHNSRKFIPTLSMWILGTFFICFPFSSRFVIMVIFCAVIGLAQGFYYPSMWLLVNSVTGRNYTMAVGLTLFFAGIGCVIGPPLGGFLYDVTKNYKVTFPAVGSGNILSGLLLLIAALRHQPTKNDDKTPEDLSPVEDTERLVELEIMEFRVSTV